MVVKRNRPRRRNVHVQPLHLRIRLARVAKGLSQKELGGKVGVAYQHVSDWERGKIKPRTDNIEKIAAVTEVSLPWLVRGEGWMVCHDWPPDVRDWLAAQLLLHDVRQVVIVAYPDVGVQKIGFLVDISMGILSIAALRKGLLGRPSWERRDGEAYVSILRDLRRQDIRMGYVALPGEQRGASSLGELSPLLSQATFENVIEREIETLPEALLSQPDQTVSPTPSNIGVDRRLDASRRTHSLPGVASEGAELARLMKNADPDTLELIGRLLREADQDVKKLIRDFLDARHQLIPSQGPLKPLKPSRRE